MTAAVLTGMKDGPKPRVAAKSSVRGLGIVPGLREIRKRPGDACIDIIVIIYGYARVIEFQVQQLVVLEPMFLPGGGRRCEGSCIGDRRRRIGSGGGLVDFFRTSCCQ